MNIGGAIEGEGGYGCLFIPSLECEKKMEKTKNIKYVSKLMLKKYAIEEVNLINEIKKKLCVIPKYSNYFLLNNISICENVKTLKESDLENIERHDCDMIYEDLTKLAFLNMPYGGIDFSSYILSNGGSKQRVFFRNSTQLLLVIQNPMVHLLFNGIIPMNRENVYHFDMKSSNLLVDESTYIPKLRIIDWGLSFYNTGSTQPIFNKVIHFNLPLSVMFVNNTFVKKYNEYLETLTTIDNETCMLFVYDYVSKFINGSYRGHMDVIVEKIFKKVLYYENNYIEKLNILFNNYYKNTVLPYTIKNPFTKKYQFRIHEYVNEIFLPNADIYGFLTCYYNIFEYLDILKNKNSSYFRGEEKLYDYLSKFLIKYLLTATRYDKTELFRDLQEINKIIGLQSTSIKKTNIRKTTNSSSFSPISRSDTPKNKSKRCYKGSRKNKKTGLCEEFMGKKSTPIQNNIKLKRCPTGSRKNKKTGICVILN